MPKPGIELGQLLRPIEGDKSLRQKEGLMADDLDKVKQLRAVWGVTDPEAR